MQHSPDGATRRSCRGHVRGWATRSLAAAVGFAPGVVPAIVEGRFCSATAAAQLDACRFEVREDFLTAKAVCINVSDDEERNECVDEAEAARVEARALCREQYAARRDLCGEIGEARYDPGFDPADFDDDFTDLTTPNPFFPLAPGHHWEFAGGEERIVIEVLDETKLVEGVTCIVVNDRVEVAGEVIEDTDDWFAHARSGDVLYCGEEVKDFETFAGDVPALPELIRIDGSFKAGRDGDKPGILFPIAPAPGEVHRQEFSAGNAEDVIRILSTTYRYGVDPELDELVPPELAELFCSAGDCVVTYDFSPLSPGAFERKYYARGIGRFLETNPPDAEVVRLVDCNVDPRCALLPSP